jgi:hypothetical protein
VVLRNASLNVLLALLLLPITSYKADSCLGGINSTLGANPSFFNMSDPVNQEILNQNLSADVKFYLLIYNTFSEMPLLSNIRSYNLLLPFSCPPNGIEVVSKNYIHNAWVRAITVMPSVTDEDGNYWALPKGEVLAAHSYSVQLPRSATNIYPDCGIAYTLLNSSASLSVYANGDYIGNSDLTSYETNSTNLSINARLAVSTSVRRDYYASYCYCCKSSKKGCEETCCYCKFSSSDTDGEEVGLNSSLGRKVYWLEASPNLTMLKCPNGLFGAAEGNFSLNTTVPIQSFLLSFGSVNFSLHSHKLDIKTVLKPHNVLETQSVQNEYDFSSGMLVTGFNISKNFTQLNFTGVPQNEENASYAELVLTDLFGIPRNFSNYTSIACPLNPEIELTMPHWAEKGSEFEVAVKLSEAGRGIRGKEVELQYSRNKYNGITDSDGKATFHITANESIVTVKSPYDGEYSEATATGSLMVYSPSVISFVLSFLAFLFILALSYIALRVIGGWNL